MATQRIFSASPRLKSSAVITLGITEMAALGGVVDLPCGPQGPSGGKQADQTSALLVDHALGAFPHR
jgi:hypothetical protein